MCYLIHLSDTNIFIFTTYECLYLFVPPDLQTQIQYLVIRASSFSLIIPRLA